MKVYSLHKSTIPLVGILLLTLTGCGGGSGGSEDNNGNNPPPGTTNNPPSVSAGLDQTVAETTQVTLSGSATDADGQINSISWTQTAGPAVVLSDTGNLSTQFTAPDVDLDTQLTFELSAQDDDGASATDTVVITITAEPNDPPTANAGNDQTTRENTQVTLNGTGSDADGTITQVLWRQLTGTSVTLENADTNTASFTTPDTDAPIQLTFEFTVTDDQGAVGSDSMVVTVNPSGTTVLAGTGTPAADFPDGFVYWSVYFPTIGANGHAAFAGAADVSIRSTDQNTAALWTGLPGQLKAIVRENDTLPGLPSNVLFDSVPHNTRWQLPVVSDNGSVAFQAALKGAVDDKDNTLLMSYYDRELYSVMRKGQQAPEMPNGYYIREVANYAFTDAGLVFHAQVSSPTLAIAAEGIWLWTPSGITLVAASEFFGMNDLDLAQEQVILDGQVCNFINLDDIMPLQINANGDIAFASVLARPDGNPGCPTQAIMRVRNGLTEVAVYDDQPVPGFSGYLFNFPNLFLAIHPYHLGPEGDISFTAPMIGNSETIYGNWVAYPDGDIDFLMIHGETLPLDDATTINANLALGSFGAPLATNDGNYWLQALTQTSNDLVFLAGNTIPVPYSDTANVGQSHLSQVVRGGDVPPGYSDTFYFDDMNPDFSNYWQLSGTGDLLFLATVADALAPLEKKWGIWKADKDGNLEEVIAIGDEVTVNGTTTTVQLLLFQAGRNGRQISNWQGGQARQISESNQLITQSRLANTYQAVLLIDY